MSLIPAPACAGLARHAAYFAASCVIRSTKVDARRGESNATANVDVFRAFFVHKALRFAAPFSFCSSVLPGLPANNGALPDTFLSSDTLGPRRNTLITCRNARAWTGQRRSPALASVPPACVRVSHLVSPATPLCRLSSHPISPAMYG
eukprot:1655283-Pleurochrysis_carterae.AAC.1